jgi:hypothetical protein
MVANRIGLILLSVLWLLGPPLEAFARVKLITLPVRERVEIQLDNPRATLVEEERIVPLLAGVDQVDFAWANTRIDPESIVLRVIAAEHAVNVLSVSYPPNENALVWSVFSERPGPVQIRISYLIANLDRSFAYRALADEDERHMVLSQHLRVRNRANEAFGDSGLYVGFGERLRKPIGVDETKEIRLARFAAVPIRKTYTADAVEHGYLDRAQDKLRVPMHYVLVNDAGHGLGQAALPAGKFRIFQASGRAGSAFIGEDWGEFTPREDELALYLGVAQDVVVKRTIARNERRRIAGNLYDHDVVVRYAVENFKDAPLTLDVVEHLVDLRRQIGLVQRRPVEWALGPETDLETGPVADKSDAQRLHFRTELPGRGPDERADTQVRRLHLIIKNEWVAP